MWFEIDPNSIAFGRVYSLLPNLTDLNQIGIRLIYGVEDGKKLRERYLDAYPADEAGQRARTLSQYLATDNNFSRACAVR